MQTYLPCSYLAKGAVEGLHQAIRAILSTCYGAPIRNYPPLSYQIAIMSKTTPAFKLPSIYSLFFLVIEPISALAGAYYANFHPSTYLTLTHPAIPSLSGTALPLSTTIALSQLANLYLLFALNEALVLRSTSDLRVWKTFLFGLLVADFGHLYSVSGLGHEIYWRITEWNSMAWGNVGFVYVGACMRICFLSGVGLGTEKGREAAMRKRS